MKNRFFLITLVILTAGLLAAPNIRAQDEDQPQGAPPAQPEEQAQTAVARISVIHGNVSTMHDNGGQWTVGTVNTPLVPGDSVATADQSRTEIQLDYADVMRLGEHTEAKIADLEQNKVQIQLGSGIIVYSAFKDTQTDSEIDTPNMGVHLLSPGAFRIQVDSPSATELIVLQGQAEVLTNQGSTKVGAGQMIQVHGTDNPEYKIDQAPGADEFDKWCFDRDRQIQTAQAQQHTDQYYTGSGDLQGYGQWEQVPDYGWCWTPEVDAGWVPYSVGNWGWEPYWGWTWISGEPWGWAPYHYGRWFMYGSRWCWWPAVGAFGLRPIWAPAYVSFFGFGRRGFGMGAGFGFGSIGWLALGPRDIFHPWYGVGHRFGAMNFNDFHRGGFVRPGGPAYGSNLGRVMSDARMRGAIRNVSYQQFSGGRMGRSMPVSESMLRSGSMMRGSLPVAHTAASMGNRVTNMSRFHVGTTNSQHFFSSRSTTAAGRLGGNRQAFGARSNSPAMGRAQAGAGNGARQSYSWQRYATRSQSGRWPAAVNGPSTRSTERSPSAAHGTRPSWDRFASPSPYSRGSGNARPAQRGGGQGYSSQPRNYGGGNGRTGSSYYNRGSRPPLQLNRPIMRQRAPSGYYGGGRGYSAPSQGSRNYSAPRGGGGHSYSAPRSSGGGHSYGGGGGHSYGGGGGHGGGHGGGGGGGHRR